jgi:hypothetical protein
MYVRGVVLTGGRLEKALGDREREEGRKEGWCRPGTKSPKEAPPLARSALSGRERETNSRLTGLLIYSMRTPAPTA